jgi:hypothetical protein
LGNSQIRQLEYQFDHEIGFPLLQMGSHFRFFHFQFRTFIFPLLEFSGFLLKRCIQLLEMQPLDGIVGEGDGGGCKTGVDDSDVRGVASRA